MLPRCCALACALLALTHGPAARANDAIGYVAALEGSAEVTRGAKTRPLALGETILGGDTVTAQSPHRLRVDTRAGPVWVCGARASERDCRRTFEGKPVGALGAWWSRAQAMMSWFHRDPGNVVTRGGEAPAVLLGRNTPQKIVAGEGLSVSWSRGDEPFMVRLTSGGRLVAQTEAKTRSIRLPVTLAPGPLTLTIEDREKRTTRVALTVVAAGPKPPDLSAAAVDPDHRSLLEAAWLADQDNGAWLFEAFRRTAAVAERVPAAAAFRAALALGERP